MLMLRQSIDARCMMLISRALRQRALPWRRATPDARHVFAAADMLPRHDAAAARQRDKARAAARYKICFR